MSRAIPRLGRQLLFMAAAAACLAAVAMGSSTALAQGYVVQVTERPMTLSEGLMRPALDFRARYGGGDVALFLDLGVEYGVNDDIEVGIVAVPLNLSPEFQFASPSVYATWRFLDVPQLELGAYLSLSIPVSESKKSSAETVLPLYDSTRMSLVFGLPLYVPLGDGWRLRSGTYLGVSLPSDGKSAIASLGVPLNFDISLSTQAFVLFRTGFFVPEMKFDNITIPVGIGIGYTFINGDPAGDLPLVDIAVGFDFPNFWRPGIDGETTSTSLWETSVSALFYFDLLD